ncbi:MAG: hypothetical protein AABX83_04020 [Nanoarchaeota archaeon]
MQIDLIKEIFSTVVNKIGENIVNILYQKKNVNELIIAKKLNLTINQTRNLLYRLLDNGLVKFTRKKDKKKGGWYIYFWTLEETRSLEQLKNYKIKKINELESELEKKRLQRCYYDPTSEREYNEEEALEHNFISPETGEVLQLKDNKEYLNKIDIEISKSKLLMEEIRIELEKLRGKKEKKMQKDMEIEKKKKKKERKKRQKASAKLKVLENKKVVKKIKAKKKK